MTHPLSPSPFLRPGDRVGDYVLVEVVGEGAFGTVFRAQQVHPVRREVALKVLKPGMDTAAVVERFAAERQTLARMDHPSVARVYDAGATPAGLPYFVMELVAGRPVTRFAEEARLDLTARLELFQQICLAVHHAHSKGVIHRDLKPLNLLVVEQDGRPLPKVIDFGIAKLLAPRAGHTGSGLTEEGQSIGTPAYMSPEQFQGGDVDTRSDVYALGVVLYELITGSLPFEARELPALRCAILQDEPTRPELRRSELRRLMGERAPRDEIPRDLDWVCLRCLEKERARRYPSAAALAEDVRRFLSNEPVEAAPPGTAYRLAKFVRRHTLLVGTAAAIFVGLLLATAGATMGMLRARDAELRAEQSAAEARLSAQQAQAAELLAREAEATARESEDQARREADRANRISIFLEDTLKSLDPTQLGERMRSAVLERLLDEQDLAASPTRPADDPHVLLQRVNMTDVARRVLDQSLLAPLAVRIGDALADDLAITANLQRTLGAVALQLGLHERALTAFRQYEALASRLTGPESSPTRAARALVGYTLAHLGRHAEAIAVWRELLETERRVLGPEHPVTLDTLRNLAGRLSAVQPAEAVLVAREADEIGRRVEGEEDRDVLANRRTLAIALLRSGDLAGAEAVLVELLATQRRVLGEDHDDVVDSLNTLATVRSDGGRFEEAVALLQEVLARREERLGRDHISTLMAAGNLGTTYTRAGRLDEAEAVLVRAHASVQRMQLERHQRGISLAGSLGNLRYRQGRLEEAVLLLERALSDARAVLDDDDPQIATKLQMLAKVYRDQGRLAEAEVMQQEALARRTRDLGVQHADTLESVGSLAYLRAVQGRLDEARELYHANLDSMREVLGPRHPSTVRTLYNLGCVAAMQGARDTALRWLTEAVDNGYDRPRSMGGDDDLASLRGDPVFETLLERARANAEQAQTP